VKMIAFVAMVIIAGILVIGILAMALRIDKLERELKKKGGK